MRRTSPRRGLAVAVALALVSCRNEVRDAAAPNPVAVGEAVLTDEQRAWLAELAARADHEPKDFAAQRASGLAHMQMTLAGAVELQERAERDLERAFALDPSDRELTRSLGRFYNMRAVAGDDAKADMQVRVYAAHLGELVPDAMTTSEFVSWSFSRLGRILSLRNRGQLLKALAAIRELEDELARRAGEEPDNIELHALAGNFAFFFAGNVPFDKKRRVKQAVRYFEHVRARWDDLRAGARDPLHCPNTRENFMFELAEGHLALGEIDQAVAIYEELQVITEPRTRAKEQIAYVAGERIENAAAYSGALELMPPWPSDIGNCVVCHSWSAPVPMDSLYSLAPISKTDIPSTALAKPIGDLGMGKRPPEPARRSPESVPAPQVEVNPIRKRTYQLFLAKCMPCHSYGGEAGHLLMLDDEGVAQTKAARILERTEAGEMPPDGALSTEELELLRAWKAEVEAAN